jgi:hypothetical protein
VFHQHLQWHVLRNVESVHLLVNADAVDNDNDKTYCFDDDDDYIDGIGDLCFDNGGARLVDFFRWSRVNS